MVKRPPPQRPEPAPEGQRSWFRKKRHWIPLAFLAAGVAMAVFAYVSPWPSALLIRAVFEDGARKTVAEMEPYVPTTGVDAQLDVPFDVAGASLPFDVFYPTGTTEQLPTVVWIHGGAWISGSKENVDPYVRILASHGYTTVALTYTVSPEATYPTALTQLNDALGFLVENAEELHIDPDAHRARRRLGRRQPRQPARRGHHRPGVRRPGGASRRSSAPSSFAGWCSTAASTTSAASRRLRVSLAGDSASPCGRTSVRRTGRTIPAATRCRRSTS